MCNFLLAIAMQFSNIIRLPLHKKIPAQLQGVLAKFGDIKRGQDIQSFQFSCNFSEVAMPAKDMVHTDDCTCDGNAIIS